MGFRHNQIGLIIITVVGACGGSGDVPSSGPPDTDNADVGCFDGCCEVVSGDPADFRCSPNDPTATIGDDRGDGDDDDADADETTTSSTGGPATAGSTGESADDSSGTRTGGSTGDATATSTAASSGDSTATDTGTATGSASSEGTG